MLDKKTLYLVSAEKNGQNFWKIGTTELSDPLKLDKKHFIECHRKEILGSSPAKNIAKAILLNINNLISSCTKDGFILRVPMDGFSYDLPLDVIENIYDFWVDIYDKPDEWSKCIGLLKFRSSISFTEPFIRKSFIGNTVKLALKLERLHSYRPNSSFPISIVNEPMWS
tara:strand:+ start:612 stop:1118 length:507 start_codon:yes stop_codon:yes gene_type:complete